jgi:ABC-type sugar transport system ATPase subunit
MSIPENKPRLLEGRSICKRFGGVTALEDVDLIVRDQEVIGLVGDNGAGKSTLIKIIAGVLPLDSGKTLIDGKEVQLKGPKHAKTYGIETVYQDLALCDNLNSYLNIFLGRYIYLLPGRLFGLIDKRSMKDEAERVLNMIGAEISDQNTLVGYLSGGQRQGVAIGRTMYTKPRLIILDEPTAALGVGETQKVLKLITGLKNQGIAVIFISHTMQEIFETADRVLVLRNGRKVGDKRIRETNIEEVIQLMIG